MRIALAKVPVFASNNRSLDPTSVVSAGIYSLAAVVRREGFAVHVADPARWPEEGEWRDGLLSWLGKDADVVGLSSHSFNWGMTREVIAELRRQRPDVTIVLGGVHPTHRAEHVLRTTEADYAVIGEGEVALPRLLRALAGGDTPDVPGAAYRAEGGLKVNPPSDVPLDRESCPVPAYDLMPERTYSALAFETSRGCAGRCAFCSIPSRQKWRPFSVNDVMMRIADTIAVAGDRVVKRLIYFTDDCLTIDRDRAIQLCHRLHDAKLDVGFALEARVNDLLDERLLQALSALGPIFIQVGVECGYERGLKLVRKGTTIERIQRCAEMVDRHNLSSITQFSFIIGLPWEDEQDCLQTLRFAFDLGNKHGIIINTSWWLPMPSMLWDERERYGINCADEVFDTAGYARNESVFWATHPRIDGDARKRLENWFAAFAALGVPLRVGRPALATN